MGVLMNMKLLTAIVISLLIGVGIGYSVSVLQISALQSEKSRLESQISKLTTDYDNAREFAYELLPPIYRERDADYTNLTVILNQLQVLYDDLDAIIEELEQMVDCEISVLTDEEYYQSIINDLQNANETILVAMYSMIYDPDDSSDWANDLARELVYADQRGVNVSVVIEYRTYWDYMNQNLEAYNYLFDNNVDVHLDYENTTDHMKLVIIDNDVVYVGSHNWSESALYYNHETSVKLVNEDVAKIFKEYLETTFSV